MPGKVSFRAGFTVTNCDQVTYSLSSDAGSLMHWGPRGEIFVDGCDSKFLESDCSNESNPTFAMGDTAGAKHQYICLNKKGMSKYDHKEKAEDHDGELMKVNTEELKDGLKSFLVEQSASAAWISGKRSSSADPPFVYDDDEEFPEDLHLWYGNEPNDSYGTEDCVEMYGFNGLWNDRTCANPRPALYNVPDPIEDEDIVCRSIEGLIKGSQIWYLDGSNNDIRSRGCPNVRIPNNWKVRQII